MGYQQVLEEYSETSGGVIIILEINFNLLPGHLFVSKDSSLPG